MVVKVSKGYRTNGRDLYRPLSKSQIRKFAKGAATELQWAAGGFEELIGGCNGAAHHRATRLRILGPCRVARAAHRSLLWLSELNFRLWGLAAHRPPSCQEQA